MNLNTKSVIGSLYENAVKGDVGIEIEVEGTRLPRSISSGWNVERDGSLKASEAYEYITNGPQTRKQFVKRLEEINKAFTENKASVFDSKRGSVHVHVNVTAMTPRQVHNFVTLGIMLESVLADQCTDDRKGNLFCLRTRDAEDLIPRWTDCFQTGRFSRAQGQIKYSFMNLACIDTLGTLEFRGMFSTIDPEVLIPWVDLLCAVRDLACTFENGQEILERLSTEGINTIIEPLPEGIVVDEAALWEDIRRSQEFIYEYYA